MDLNLLIEQLIQVRDKLDQSGKHHSNVQFASDWWDRPCLLITPEDWDNFLTSNFHNLNGHINIQTDYNERRIEITLN